MLRSLAHAFFLTLFLLPAAASAAFVASAIAASAAATPPGSPCSSRGSGTRLVESSSAYHSRDGMPFGVAGGFGAGVAFGGAFFAIVAAGFLLFGVGFGEGFAAGGCLSNGVVVAIGAAAGARAAFGEVRRADGGRAAFGVSGFAFGEGFPPRFDEGAFGKAGGGGGGGFAAAAVDGAAARTAFLTPGRKGQFGQKELQRKRPPRSWAHR